MSERDGWGHLYLYDGASGAVKNQITRGEWVVRGVQRVDEAKRQIWFCAGGTHAGKDPYFLSYFRINFDGTGLTELTTADANHNGTYSTDGELFVDNYSRLDLAPVLDGAHKQYDFFVRNLLGVTPPPWTTPRPRVQLNQPGEC